SGTWPPRTLLLSTSSCASSASASESPCGWTWTCLRPPTRSSASTPKLKRSSRSIAEATGFSSRTLVSPPPTLSSTLIRASTFLKASPSHPQPASRPCSVPWMATRAGSPCRPPSRRHTRSRRHPRRSLPTRPRLSLQQPTSPATRSRSRSPRTPALSPPLRTSRLRRISLFKHLLKSTSRRTPLPSSPPPSTSRSRKLSLSKLPLHFPSKRPSLPPPPRLMRRPSSRLLLKSASRRAPVSPPRVSSSRPTHPRSLSRVLSTSSLDPTSSTSSTRLMKRATIPTATRAPLPSTRTTRSRSPPAVASSTQTPRRSPSSSLPPSLWTILRSSSKPPR
ncbi:hypothetical protein OC844_008081, partial [Tilletia horrida]